jgi:hypothetical protein
MIKQNYTKFRCKISIQIRVKKKSKICIGVMLNWIGTVQVLIRGLKRDVVYLG